MRNVYFISVNFNNAEFTKRYLKSIMLLDSSIFRIYIIIVDNASKYSDYENLKRTCIGLKNIKLIRNYENIGYFKALNCGITSVDVNSPEDENSLFVIGNNDIEFKSNFLSELGKILYDNRTLVLAPDVVTSDGVHQNPHCVKRVSIFRKIGYKIYYTNYTAGKFLYWLTQKQKNCRWKKKDTKHLNQKFIYMGIGACYIITEHFFKYYNKLDDRIFLWGEEALLAGQVRSVGGRTLYHPNIVVYHAEGKSIEKIPSKNAYLISKESYKIYSKYL